MTWHPPHYRPDGQGGEERSKKERNGNILAPFAIREPCPRGKRKGGKDHRKRKRKRKSTGEGDHRAFRGQERFPRPGGVASEGGERGKRMLKKRKGRRRAWLRLLGPVLSDVVGNKGGRTRKKGKAKINRVVKVAVPQRRPELRGRLRKETRREKGRSIQSDSLRTYRQLLEPHRGEKRGKTKNGKRGEGGGSKNISADTVLVDVVFARQKEKRGKNTKEKKEETQDERLFEHLRHLSISASVVRTGSKWEKGLLMELDRCESARRSLYPLSRSVGMDAE